MGFEQFFRVLRASRWVVVVFWALLAGGMVYPALQFISVTSSKYDPPKNTAGYYAAQTFKTNFPDMARRQLSAVLVTRRAGDNASVLTPFVSRLTAALRDDIVPAAGAPAGMVNGVLGYFTLFENYSVLAQNFVDPDERATIIVVPTFEFDQEETWAGKVRSGLRAWLDANTPLIEHNDTADYVCQLTGMPALIHDTMAGTTADLGAMDSIALPIALLVLALVLRSLPLLIIPVISLGASFAISFGVMYFVAKYMLAVASFCPAVMASVVIALSFDWSLFLLSRWREELATRRLPRRSPNSIFYKPVPVGVEENAEAVAISVRNAGKTVATSGTVLFACFLSMTVLPLAFVQTFGLAAAVAIFFTIATNLTLTPVLLLIFRVFFSLDGFLPGVDISALFHCHSCSDENNKNRFSFFRWLGAHVSRLPLGFVATLFVLAIGIALAYFAQGVTTTKNLLQMVPYGSESLETFYTMEHTGFAPGMSFPYYLVVTPKENAPIGKNNSYVWTEEFFDETYACASDLSDMVDGLETANIVGVVIALGEQVTYDWALQLADPTGPWGKSDLGIAYREMLKYLVNEPQNASFLSLATSFPPPNNITDFLKVARSVVDNCTARNGSHYRFQLAGDLVSMEDAVTKTLKLFPTMAGCTFAIVALFLVVVFRTVMLPIRTLLTIAVTLASAFGAASIIFVNGTFDSLSDILASNEKALFWFTPICSFIVILGLSLDYDLFLFTRILENRAKGLSTKDAVSNAVAHSGKVIFFAGLIMAIAFGGLLGSKLIAVVQIGFMMCFGVLLDTLFVHTFLVPGVVSMLREANWWPRRFGKRGGSGSPEVVADERTGLIQQQQ